MFNNEIPLVQTCQRIEAPIVLALENQETILRHFEEVHVLYASCRFLDDCRNNSGNLGREIETKQSTRVLRPDDGDGAFRVEGLEFLVRAALGHGRAMFTNATGHSAPSRLKADGYFLKSYKARMTKNVQIDSLLVRIQLRSQVVLKFFKELRYVHTGRMLTSFYRRFSETPPLFAGVSH
jgi:hypothetical protein